MHSVEQWWQFGYFARHTRHTQFLQRVFGLRLNPTTGDNVCDTAKDKRVLSSIISLFNNNLFSFLVWLTSRLYRTPEVGGSPLQSRGRESWLMVTFHLTWEVGIRHGTKHSEQLAISNGTPCPLKSESREAPQNPDPQDPRCLLRTSIEGKAVGMCSVLPLLIWVSLNQCHTHCSVQVISGDIAAVFVCRKQQENLAQTGIPANGCMTFVLERSQLVRCDGDSHTCTGNAYVT